MNFDDHRPSPEYSGIFRNLLKKVNQVILLGRFYKVRPGLHLLTNENLAGTGYKPITGQNDRREEVKS